MAPSPTAPAKIKWGSTVVALMHQWRESGGREETERIGRHKRSPDSEATPVEPIRLVWVRVAALVSGSLTPPIKFYYRVKLRGWSASDEIGFDHDPQWRKC